MKNYPTPPFEDQPQTAPGSQQKMHPVPDCGEESYIGSGRLAGKMALITGADSGMVGQSRSRSLEKMVTLPSPWPNSHVKHASHVLAFQDQVDDLAGRIPRIEDRTRLSKKPAAYMGTVQLPVLVP